jgi:hypothetical protein
MRGRTEHASKKNYSSYRRGHVRLLLIKISIGRIKISISISIYHVSRICDPSHFVDPDES